MKSTIKQFEEIYLNCECKTIRGTVLHCMQEAYNLGVTQAAEVAKPVNNRLNLEVDKESILKLKIK